MYTILEFRSGIRSHQESVDRVEVRLPDEYTLSVEDTDEETFVFVERHGDTPRECIWSAVH